MKNHFYLSIEEQCSENWDSFIPNPQGKHCTSCCKTVIDFTKMSEKEIIDFFKNSPQYTCGRFFKEQLKEYSPAKTVYPRSNSIWIKTGLLSLLMLVLNKQANSQIIAPEVKQDTVQFPSKKDEKKKVEPKLYSVRGKVVDETNEAIHGASIIVKGTSKGTMSDSRGQFDLSGLEEGDELILTFIGYDSKHHIVTKSSSEIIELKVVMDYQILMGAVAISAPYKEQPKGFRKLWHQIKNIF